MLVHAAAGGVGLLLTQIAKLRGARVIATTSGGEKAELARGAGADEVIGYEGFHERVRELTGGEGVAAVYDGIGRTTFDDGLKALRPAGTMVIYGSASGQPDPVDTRVLAARGSLYVQRPTLGTYTRTRELLLARAGEVFDWCATGSSTSASAPATRSQDAAKSHEDLEARRTTGKLLLHPLTARTDGPTARGATGPHRQHPRGAEALNAVARALPRRVEPRCQAPAIRPNRAQTFTEPGAWHRRLAFADMSARKLARACG